MIIYDNGQYTKYINDTRAQCDKIIDDVRKSNTVPGVMDALMRTYARLCATLDIANNEFARGEKVTDAYWTRLQKNVRELKDELMRHATLIKHQNTVGALGEMRTGKPGK